MPKSSRQKIITKKHLARVEREKLQTRYILLGTLVVVLMVIGFVGYGILQQYVLTPIKPVAVVNGDQITTRDFQKRVKYMRQNIISRYYQTAQFAQMFGSDPSTLQYFKSSLEQYVAQLDPTTVGQQTLDEMIDDRLIAQEAAARGITVSEEEINEYLQESFGFFPNGTPTPTSTQPPPPPPSTLSPTQLALVSPTPTITPTPVPTVTVVVTATATPVSEATPTLTPTPTGPVTPTATATPYTIDLYNQNLKETLDGLKAGIGLDEADLRAIVRDQLLREKVRDDILADLPREQEQVWARHILVTNEISATEVLAKLASGKDFGQLAAEVSTDSGSASRGGDLGWFVREDMVEEFSDAAFSMDIGQISNPVQSQYGWHIIQLLGRETRPLDDQKYEQLRQTKFDEWLKTKRESSDVETIVVGDIEYWTQVTPAEPVIPDEHLPDNILGGS